MQTTVPTAEAQLTFLKNVQRILDEGGFTATYKFALLHALADLAVQKGDDSGAALTLGTREIAERFVELYWRQVIPWPGGEREALLSQNTGRQAAVVRRVHEARAEYGDQLRTIRRDRRSWARLVRRVDRIVREMPLWRLQRVGGEVHDFLYPHAESRNEITLRPGVAYCLRTFYPLVTELVQSGWARFLRWQNPDLLGEQAELRDFLFGSTRNALGALRPALMEIQEGRCFYCENGLRETGHVDHFIPWSRYPTDLGHNFVLTHEACNRRKSDHLAAVPHLERWARRNRDHGYELTAAFENASWPHHLDASLQITRWSYGQTAARGGQVWRRGRELVPLGQGWEALLGQWESNVNMEKPS